MNQSMDFLIEDVHDQSYQIKKKIIITKMVPEERWTAMLSSLDSFDMELVLAVDIIDFDFHSISNLRCRIIESLMNLGMYGS